MSRPDKRSGEGTPSQRSTLPSFVSCSPLPTPLAGSLHSSTSSDSSDKATSQAMSVALRTFLETLAYPYTDETANPVYRLFLS